jgi:predicted TIM-barrel fold metal-dependent hydrolase
MSQAVSLIFNGVFDELPELRVILIEGGFTYVPHLIWTADQQYKELRHEVPWVKRPPGRIIREQMRFASQPTVEMTSAELETLIDQMGSDELICFSTDYPHWDFDSPLEALPSGLPQDLARRIYLDNARATYRRLPIPVA